MSDTMPLMGKDKTQKTQKTKPKKGEPIAIPVPKKSQIMRDFEKIATTRHAEVESDEDE